MAIIYTAALAYETTLAMVDEREGFFDPNYAPYGLKTFPYEAGQVFTGFTPIPQDAPQYDYWIHFRQVREGSWGGGGVQPQNMWEALSPEGDVLFRVYRDTNASKVTMKCGGSTGGEEANIIGYFPTGFLITFDLHFSMDGTEWKLEFYVNGIKQTEVSLEDSRQLELQTFRVGAHNGSSFSLTLSEVIMTDGEPTLGSRLATMSPTGVAEINTWDGTWESLGDDDTGSGISTENLGARIAGLFSAYLGTTSPVGIRAVVQSHRYVDNESGLAVSGFLRDDGVNDDTHSDEGGDASRVFTIWDQNPFTDADWDVADLADVRGGVRSVIAS